MATFDLRKFRSSVIAPQRSNKFTFNIYKKNSVLNAETQRRDRGATIGVEKLSLIAEQVIFPTITLVPRVSTHPYGFGLEERFPTQPQYKELIANFIFERGGETYQFFENWMNEIYYFNGKNNTASQFEMDYKDNYDAKLEINLLKEDGPDEDNTVTGRWEFTKAYPISITGEPLSWAAENEYMVYFVNFDFYQCKFFGSQTPIPNVDTGVNRVPVLRQTRRPDYYNRQSPSPVGPEEDFVDQFVSQFHVAKA